MALRAARPSSDAKLLKHEFKDIDEVAAIVAAELVKMSMASSMSLGVFLPRTRGTAMGRDEARSGHNEQ